MAKTKALISCTVTWLKLWCAGGIFYFYSVMFLSKLVKTLIRCSRFWYTTFRVYNDSRLDLPVLSSERMWILKHENREEKQN